MEVVREYVKRYASGVDEYEQTSVTANGWFGSRRPDPTTYMYIGTGEYIFCYSELRLKDLSVLKYRIFKR